MDFVETWLPVVGYEVEYSVSNLGRIRRDGVAHGAKVGRIRKLVTINGYHFVSLRKNNKSRQFSVHKLVAQAFIGPRPKGLDINHINGDRKDNRRENLEYVTRLQNMQHACNVLNSIRGSRARGEANPSSKMTEATVREARDRYARGGVTQLELAKEYGIAERNMARLIHRQSWSHV